MEQKRNRMTSFKNLVKLKRHILKPIRAEKSRKDLLKSYRCPKFGGDAKQTLEIRVERKRNLKLGELGEVNFAI